MTETLQMGVLSQRIHEARAGRAEPEDGLPTLHLTEG
jgi:hypothetical protein